jgi:hypothetical protein
MNNDEPARDIDETPERINDNERLTTADMAGASAAPMRARGVPDADKIDNNQFSQKRGLNRFLTEEKQKGSDLGGTRYKPGLWTNRAERCRTLTSLWRQL